MNHDMDTDLPEFGLAVGATKEISVVDENHDYERMKGLHAMSEAEFAQMEREQAPMMVGTKPWLDPEYAAGMQGVNPHRHELETPQVEHRQSWWKRRDWWRL